MKKFIIILATIILTAVIGNMSVPATIVTHLVYLAIFIWGLDQYNKYMDKFSDNETIPVKEWGK